MATIEIFIVTIIVTFQRVILSLVHFLLFEKNITKADRILILRSSALGDFIFAIPSMVLLRRMYPNAEIKLLTISTSDDTVRNQVINYVGSSNELPWVSFVSPSIIDDVFCMTSLNAHYIRRNVAPLIQKFDPDLTVILPQQGAGNFKGSLKKLLLLKYLGIRCRVFGWTVKNCFVFKQAQYEAGLLEHAVMAPFRTVCEIPHDQPQLNINIEFPLDVNSDTIRWAQKLWTDNGWDSRRIVAVAPGSIQPHKKWPIEKFEELCRSLKENSDVLFIVVGIKDDIELGDRLIDSLSGAGLNLAGKTSVIELAALLQKCNLLVGNDGGAMHLGSAMGCPVVSIVPGLEYPGSIEPWHSRELVVRHTVPCAPCYSMTFCPQGHNSCMTDILVKDVISNCMKVLKKK
jgi:heptosyltransferase-2